MALCLRVPMQLPHISKYRYFQCCRYLSWNRIRSIKKKAREKLGPSIKANRYKSESSNQSKNDIENYFENLGRGMSGPYLTLLKDLTEDIPKPPTSWQFTPGWTCYTSSGFYSVKHPREKALVFDVEVCVREGFYPTIAAAVSQRAWYLWVSPQLVHNEEACSSIAPIKKLIRMGTSPHPRLIVGHFISYDRARIVENYNIEDVKLRYFDTMSAHTCVSGVTNVQRNLMFSSSYDQEEWRQLSCPNSLGHISEFYCGITLDKSCRNIFVEGSLQEIAKDFQVLSSYCAEDVVATHKVLCKLLPLFLERQPHSVTLAGMLELSTAFFPVSKTWERRVGKIESSAYELKEEQFRLMKQRADKSLSLAEESLYRMDPWMWDLDWKPQRWKSQVLPSWYKAFCMGCAKSIQESNGSSAAYAGLTVPKILRLCCGPYPLHYINRLGWGVIIPLDKFVGQVNAYLDDEMPLLPVKQIEKLCEESLSEDRPAKVPSLSSLMESLEYDLYWRETSSAVDPEVPTKDIDSIQELLISERFVFRRLLNVGSLRPVRNPLGITVSKSVTSLNSPEPEGRRFLQIRDNLMPWLSHGKKWMNQDFVDAYSHGFILPLVEVCSDYLRLPRERTWASLLMLQKDHLGAELLKSVKSPPHDCLITVSIDNLDLWLAAMLSDRVNGGNLGSTKFSSYFISGVLFDKVASATMISPEEAEYLCHAVVAGADAFMIAKLISQAHVNISWDESFQRASKCMDIFSDYKLLNANPHDLWPGLDADELETPLLGARMSRPLELEKTRVRLRAHWLIHSSKADYIHLFITCFLRLQPNSRLCFVHPDNMCLYFLGTNHDQALSREILKNVNQKVQSFCLSRLGLSGSPEQYNHPINITVSRHLSLS